MATTLPFWFAVLALVPAASSARSAPWNGSGHRIVSLLAWSKLSPAARREVATLLRAHPRFVDDLQIALPPDSEPTIVVRHAFALAATWPDTVRSPTHPMHRIADHPTWHYVDLPFVLDSVEVPPRPAPAGPAPHDVVGAIVHNLTLLGDREQPAADRAIALCWVLHLIQDVHQPLHACTLYSARFPDGDAGGNRFLVTRSPFDARSQTNLHALWDELLGDYQSQRWEACLVDGLAARPEFAGTAFAAEVAIHDPAAWARESHDLAVRYAYLHGDLEPGAAAPAESERAPLLPPGYLAAAENVAMRRAMVAACRLADVLNRTFAAK